jgi:hypothetical protein
VNTKPTKVANAAASPARTFHSLIATMETKIPAARKQKPSMVSSAKYDTSNAVRYTPNDHPARYCQIVTRRLFPRPVAQKKNIQFLRIICPGAGRSPQSFTGRQTNSPSWPHYDRHLLAIRKTGFLVKLNGLAMDYASERGRGDAHPNPFRPFPTEEFTFFACIGP